MDFMESTFPQKFLGRRKIVKSQGIISATHPFAWRAIVTPSGFVTKHDLHCTTNKANSRPWEMKSGARRYRLPVKCRAKFRGKYFVTARAAFKEF